jgi:hypothetical protein
MATMIEVDSDLKPISYAWPGGYPVYYLVKQGFRNDETLELEDNPYDREEFITCPKCASDKGNDLILIGYDINWEDDNLHCEVCSKLIELAYVED